MGRIITILLIIVLIVGGVWWWRNYHDANLYDGSVIRRDAAMATGTTTLENGQNIGEAHPTPSRSDAPGTLNGDPYHGAPQELGIQTTPITQDPYGQGGVYAPTGTYGAGGAYPATGTGPQVPPPSGRSPRSPQPGRSRDPQEPTIVYAPASPSYPSSPTDTQPPNAPNGLRFGGNGNFQWYRQGNITYRVDTRTGNSCVAYATFEEWRRPEVSRHACRAY